MKTHLFLKMRAWMIAGVLSDASACVWAQEKFSEETVHAAAAQLQRLSPSAPKKIWDNDNISELRPGGISVVGNEPTATSATESAEAGSNSGRDVCQNRQDLVGRVLGDLARVDGPNTTRELSWSGRWREGPLQPTAEEVRAIVTQNAASSNGACVYKTILRHLQRKGAIGTHLRIQEDGSSVWVTIASNGNTVVNASRLEDYTISELTLYYYQQKAHGRTIKQRCQDLYDLPKFGDPAGNELPSFCYDELQRRNPRAGTR